jgi:hypothetical protein
MLLCVTFYVGMRGDLSMLGRGFAGREISREEGGNRLGSSSGLLEAVLGPQTVCVR